MRQITKSIIGAIRSSSSISGLSTPAPPPAYRRGNPQAMSKPELVVILGTTGTGKSKLAIELAEILKPRKRAEVINGDSMQVYKGLDILTNKITADETNGIPHHLMSFLELDQDYTVERFREDAIEKITEIHRAGSLPILVGGTGYYIQNLILPGRLTKDIPPEDTTISELIKKDIHATKSPYFDDHSSTILHNPQEILERYKQKGFEPNLINSLGSLPIDLLQLVFLLPHLPPFSSPKDFPPGFPSELLPPRYRPPQATAEDFCIALHEALQIIDPVMAGRWHWRDLRKVRRSLEVPLCTGKLMSLLVAEQDQIDNQARQSQEERAPYRTLVFWLYSETDQLLPRLDARVDKMMENGLVDEVRDLKMMRESFTAGDQTRTDFSRGPFQAIGYREFESLVSTKTAETQPEEINRSKTIAEAIELTKIATRQYAKSQVKWMKNKFLPELNTKFDNKSSSEELLSPTTTNFVESSQMITTYILDATLVQEWDRNVLGPARDILSAFLRHEELPPPKSISSIARCILSESEVKKTRSLKDLQLKVCEICTTEVNKPFLIEELNWQSHMRSKKHRRSLMIKNHPRPDFKSSKLRSPSSSSSCLQASSGYGSSDGSS
ncbi:hypothetical protein Pst134EA_000201 [Puccinia striiformis f. sp. tritici]|uniref:hypothetical protein n=1 Tax=Puccinia striiformis f. sp. tritici TaxID=168172 RepID=UPI002008C41B|nr:hypothetical protein Pst134EA_000201 [Puccinia striiformis f. sp. tritici]KAH9473124.1 hypothetical protein Pst134EA_000201 [Puccinia striiformis f. sp. tritici]